MNHRGAVAGTVLAAAALAASCTATPSPRPAEKLEPVLVAPPANPADLATPITCRAIRDSVAASGGNPLYLAGEMDRVPAAIPTGDFPRFDDVNLGSGKVAMVFVIGPDGRVEPGSMRTQHATRPGLESSVRQFLERSRFTPGMVNGRQVRACVYQEFNFMNADP